MASATRNLQALSGGMVAKQHLNLLVADRSATLKGSGFIVGPLGRHHTHTYIYIHTYVHSYRHTHIYIYVHTYIHTYLHTLKRPKGVTGHGTRRGHGKESRGGGEGGGHGPGSEARNQGGLADSFACTSPTTRTRLPGKGHPCRHTCIIRIYIHTDIRTPIHTYIRIYIYIHTYMHTHMYIHTDIHTHIDVHRYIYIHTPKRGPRSRDTGHGMRWGYGEESKGGGGGRGGGHGPGSEARNKGVFFLGGSGAKLGTHVHLIIVPSVASQSRCMLVRLAFAVSLFIPQPL